MPKKNDLIEKISRKPIPKKFYEKGIGYTDESHPGTELYGYQIKKTIQFLRDIGEME